MSKVKWSQPGGDLSILGLISKILSWSLPISIFKSLWSFISDFLLLKESEDDDSWSIFSNYTSPGSVGLIFLFRWGLIRKSTFSSTFSKVPSFLLPEFRGDSELSRRFKLSFPVTLFLFNLKDYQFFIATKRLLSLELKWDYSECFLLGDFGDRYFAFDPGDTLTLEP